MNFEITRDPSDDGTIDAEYTFGRPVATYLSTLQHLRLLLLKVRLDTTSEGTDRRSGPRLFRPC
jgi:hypothetical protein